MIDADLPPAARVSFSGSVRFPIEPGRSFPRVVRFALSSRIDRSAVGREKNRGEERGRESTKLTTVFLRHGFKCSRVAVVPTRLFRFAPSLGACSADWRTHTHTRARVYTTQDTTRDERRRVVRVDFGRGREAAALD